MPPVAQVTEVNAAPTAKPKPLLRGWFHVARRPSDALVGPLIGLEANGAKAEVRRGRRASR